MLGPSVKITLCFSWLLAILYSLLCKSMMSVRLPAFYVFFKHPLYTVNFNYLYICFQQMILNEHSVPYSHMVNQILYSLAASLCFKQLIHNSNSAQPQPAWFKTETVASIHINSHICAAQSNAPLCLDTVQKLKQ